MALAVGITKSAYSNYESGDIEVPYDVIEKVSNFFGCDIAVLFEENENVDAMMFVRKISFRFGFVSDLL